MRISTQNIACSQRQMYTCIHHSVIHYEHTTCNLSVNKAAEHLINSTLVLEKKKRKKEKSNKQNKKSNKNTQSVLIKNSWGGGGGGGGGALSQTVGRIGWSIMSQAILCNYFKVCTKFTLEGAE